MSPLRLSVRHVLLWLILAVIAGFIAAWACIDYNKYAGTDLESGHIALISVSVLTGPMVGPVANPAAGDDFAIVLTAIVSPAMILSICPFVFIRRPVRLSTAALAWSGFIVCSLLWFGSSILSLAQYLS